MSGRAARGGWPTAGDPDEGEGDEPPATGVSEGETEAFLRRVAAPPALSDMAGGGARGALPGAELELDLGPEAGRFEVRRRLGEGGFGAVYEVFDRRRSAHVALKTMTRRDPRALYRFKQEFRALAELSHPNLVHLYELHGDARRWFLTMELVRGQDALSYVQAEAGARPTLDPAATGELPDRPPRFDESRLRDVLTQLAEGLCFLHAAGKLHRDVKPSNVIVDERGRVVLLDFGLVVDLVADGGHSAGAFAGTPQYMAPEQAASEPVGPAADWYAVGVLLHQALAGRLPFEGTGMELLYRKVTTDPRPPADFARGVPEDLNRLCLDLLQRAPSARPSGREVLERLARRRGPALAADSRPSPRAPAPEAPPEPASETAVFVGRRAELAELHRAFAAARAGRTSAALLHGRSGMGKSALVARFFEELRAREPAVVILAGRCFEQESVPYEALDSLIDALGRHLSRLSEAEALAILPRDVATLARLFPSLRRVPAVELAPRRADAADELTSRRRAFAALRELLARLGDRAPLVLFVDDVQWGDADGGALLAELVRPPDAPAMLVVLAYRSDDAAHSECLRVLLPALREAAGSAPVSSGGAAPPSRREPGPPALDLWDVEVETLGEAVATELALAELTRKAPSLASPERATAIARESGGWPFFIRELASAGGAVDGAHPSLEAMVWSRVSALPEGARRLLGVVAVAGRPVERAAAVGAAGLGDEGPALLGLLRKQRLVRVRGDRAKDEIEAYHDRIRETVVARLAPDAKKGLHLDVANALLATGRADAEALAAHLHAAGEAARAIEYTVHAADHALAALGLDRAARLYRQAIAAIDERDPRRRELHERLGVALGNAGRGPEAAAAYLVAAEGADAPRALDLRRRAAEHFLISGRSDEGIAVLRAVLAATGLGMPATQLGAALRLLPVLIVLWLRGLAFRERPADAVPAEELLRVDACAAVSWGMISARPMTAFYFHKRFLLLALRAGEPERVLRALIFEKGYAAAVSGGDVTSARAREIDRVMAPLAERFRDPGARFLALEASLSIVQGAAAVFGARLREGREHLERGLARSEASGARLANEVALAAVLLVGALFALGEWKEAARRQAAFLEEARARGDLFLEIEMSKLGDLRALLDDRPDDARALVNRVEALLPRADRSRRYARLVALAGAALYEEAGAGEAALLLDRKAGPAFARSGMLFVSRPVRTSYMHLRGRARLAAAAVAAGPERDRLLRAVERDAGALSRVRGQVAAAYAASLRAGAAATAGDRARARAELAVAEAAYLSLDMAMDVAACRRRLGQLAGGDEGRARIEEADAVMRAQDVRSPERVTGMLLPGKW